MRVLIVRHGETEENVRHICQGQSQGTPLRTDGKRQGL